MSEGPPDGFYPAIVLGFKEVGDGFCLPAVKTLKTVDFGKLDEKTLAGLLLLVVETVVGEVADARQIDFERKAVEIFTQGLAGRAAFLESVDES